MQKCPCAMTGLEILQANLAVSRPMKTILITDRGNGWDVVMYGPDSAGCPPEQEAPMHITIQAALESVEAALVNLRRQSDVETVSGEIITDGKEIVRALGGGA